MDDDPAAVPPGVRAALSVPCAEPRKPAKAAALRVDEIVLDLEDAVPVDRKETGREIAREYLRGPIHGRTAVRVNAVGTPWCHQDLLMCASHRGPGLSVVVPKVESAGDLAFVDRLLTGAEAARGAGPRVGVQALIETAPGLAALTEITRATPRLEALVVGYADLSASLGRAQGLHPQRWTGVLDAVIVAARAAGIRAVDGPYTGIADDEGFRAFARHSREAGFDGMWVIHPDQVATATAMFTPMPAEVGHATSVLESLERAEREGLGAVTLDGRMVDAAMALSARRTLARAGREEAR